VHTPYADPLFTAAGLSHLCSCTELTRGMSRPYCAFLIRKFTNPPRLACFLHRRGTPTHGRGGPALTNAYERQTLPFTPLIHSVHSQL